jgi:hypothetical protein
MFLKPLLDAVGHIVSLLRQILDEQKEQTKELRAIKKLLQPPPAAKLVLTLGQPVLQQGK